MPNSQSAIVLGLGPPIDDADDAPSWRWWMETAAVACLALAAVLGPLALGGTHPYGRLTINLLVAVATCIWIVSAPRSGWLAWAPLAVAAVSMLQIVPLPLSLLRLVAPVSGEAWGAVGDGAGGGWGPISIDPGATAAAIRQMFFGLSATAVTMDLCRDPRRRWLLVGVLSFSALLIWGLGLMFPMNTDHLLLGRVNLKGEEPAKWWCTTMVQPVRTAGFVEYSQSTPIVVGGHQYVLPRWSIGDGIGSYIVSNHFAAAIYLTLPILIGLCRRRLRGPVWAWGGTTLTLVMFAAGIWTVWSGAHSRAGAAATLVAAVVFMAIASAEGPARLFWGALCALTLTAMGILTAVFYGFAPGLVGLLPDGLATTVAAALRDGRVGLTHAAIAAFLRSPLFGTGLGTYGFVSGSGNADMKWTFYAHNDYAQLLAEGGLVGGAVLLVLVGVLALALVRTWRAPEEERLAAAGVWAALVALGLHSFFDWNMHVPANALLACLVAGLALSTAATFPTGCVVPRTDASLSSGTMTAVDWSNRRGVAAVILTGACALAAVLAVRDTKTELAARRLRHALMSIRTAKTPDATTLALGRLKWGIVVARTAARRHPTDREIALLAGQAALHLAAEDESLEGEDAGTWFRRARRCNPLTWGLPDPPVEPRE